MGWDVKGKTILVTGATSGIGLEACVQLLKMGARMVMVGRDRAKTENKVAEVKSRGGSQDVQHFLCDFSSQASIRKLADETRNKLQRLDVLVNNAGSVYKTRTLTSDGIETTFAVNHLGYFLFTNLVTDMVVKSAPARIVTVASVAHRRGTLDFEDLGFEKGYSIARAYGRSKLANVLFSAELARRMQGVHVTSNSVHPGGVATNIWSGAPLWAKPIIFLISPFFLSAEKGAEMVVRVATDPALEGVSGKYFEERKMVDPSPLGQDAALARRLWEVSARLVGLPPEVPSVA